MLSSYFFNFMYPFFNAISSNTIVKIPIVKIVTIREMIETILLEMSVFTSDIKRNIIAAMLL